MKGKR
jgi:hypothetical protein